MRRGHLWVQYGAVLLREWQMGMGQKDQRINVKKWIVEYKATKCMDALVPEC